MVRKWAQRENAGEKRSLGMWEDQSYECGFILYTEEAGLGDLCLSFLAVSSTRETKSKRKCL